MPRLELSTVLIVALLAALLAACGPSEGGRDWTYTTGAGHLLVEADTRGGLVPPGWAAGHIPHFRLFGDGRVVWSEERDGRTVRVLEGHLGEREVRALLDWMDEQGFFEMDEYYTVDNAPTDMPSQCIRVSLQDAPHAVCEYFDGAPEAFDEIYQRLHAGAGASDAHDLAPEIGWVTARPVEREMPGEPVAWPEAIAPALSAIGEGTWVEGEALDFLWRNRLEQGPIMRFTELGDAYQVVLQIPGLMPEAPPAP